MKLINVSNGQFIDDINKLLEGVLCLARNPREDTVVYGGDLGTPRIYKISDNQNRGTGDTARDANLIRELERQPGAVRSVAYSFDGGLIAASGAPGEVRIYKSSGQKVSTLKGMEGSTFALAFHPSRNELVTGGFDGEVRIFDASTGKQLQHFSPVPMSVGAKVAQASPAPVPGK